MVWEDGSRKAPSYPIYGTKEETGTPAGIPASVSAGGLGTGGLYNSITHPDCADRRIASTIRCPASPSSMVP